MCTEAKKLLNVTKESVIILVLISCLAVSMGSNIWQLNNVREIEKPVEVPVEVPIEVLVPSENGPRRFERFLIKGSERFDVQFGDGDTSGEFYEFVHGTVESSDVTFRGEWDVLVTFRFCEIKNTTFDLTNIAITLENCTVQDSYFEGTFDSVVHITGTAFTGVTAFDIPVVNGTGNTGLENVVFEDRVFQED